MEKLVKLNSNASLVNNKLSDFSNITSLIFKIKLSEFKQSKLSTLKHNRLFNKLSLQVNGNLNLLMLQKRTNEQLNNLFNSFKPTTKTYTYLQIKKIICECLKVDASMIKAIGVLGGLTNNNYQVLVGDKHYVVRLPGFNTAKMINREDEVLNTYFASYVGIDAKLVYINGQSGVKIMEYIPYAKTLNSTTIKEKATLMKVASTLKQLHDAKAKMHNDFDVYQKLITYESLIDESQFNLLADYQSIRTQVLDLYQQYGNDEFVPCHNDALAENFVLDNHGKLYLIDWEFGGNNSLYWDLAAVSLENELDRQAEAIFLNAYFKEVSSQQITKMLVNKIYQDFLWSVWALVKIQNGEDFNDYAQMRYQRMLSNIAQLRSS